MTRTNKTRMMEAIFKLEDREDELPEITMKLVKGELKQDRELRDAFLEGNLDWLHQMGREHGFSVSIKLMEEYQKLVAEKGHRGGLELHWVGAKKVQKQSARTQDSMVVSIR